MSAKPIKRKLPIKQILTYVVMVTAIFIVVTFLTLFMFGFRLDSNNGNLEQNALLMFDTKPSGATVSVDGTIVSAKTPNKKSVPAGKHDVVIWRDNYETWYKSVNLKAGTMTWLNYALLIPKKLTVEPVANYDALYSSLASPKGDDILIEKRSDLPVFDLVDISSNTIKTTSLTISSTLYSEPTAVGVVHSFNFDKWDEAGRYVLIKHTYNEKTEWLVLDTQNVNSTKNITRLFDLAISDMEFSGTSGNIFYALESNDIRKLDLAAGTISKPLISDVINFGIYNDSNVITYVGNGKVGTNEKVVGVYREGDDGPSVLRTFTNSSDISLHIATTNYFNANYVAIADGKKVDILSGSYPNTTSDNANSMKTIATYQTQKDIEKLTFSPTGEFVFTQSAADFASYDLEYQKFTASTIEGTGDAFLLKWLDNNNLWSNRDGKLTIREFDGANIHTINPVLLGQDATLTKNGRYLYSFNKSDTNYQLQRVRMILP